MTSPSEKAQIYYMHARVAFKKRKDVHERVMWIISVHDNPSDIMAYDRGTMNRLRVELYPKTAKEKQVIVREILDVLPLCKSNLTLEQHIKQYQK